MFAMRKIYICLLGCFYCCSVIKGQSNCDLDSAKFKIAYNYIINDSINKEKSISVSDSIVDIDRYWFSGELKNFDKEQMKLNQYRKNKNFRWFAPFYSPCLASMFCKKNNLLSNNVLFFSRIEDNMLLVEILPCKKYVNKYSYNEMAFQNVGRTYLFIFCENGNLRAVFSREMIYD